jgi:hypothetical protein
MAIILDGTSGITTSSSLTTGSGAVYNGLQASTAVASTSGTSIDFTSIPSWVKRITVMFNGVSLSATSSFLIQLASGGTVETTGYTGISSIGSQASTTTIVSSTAGFPIFSNTATYAVSGALTISNITTNTWVAQGVFSNVTTTAFFATSSGGKTLVSALDRVRITSVTGTDTFDAGSINILYE